jgi:hypothetical protein
MTGRGKGGGHVDDALARTGTARGQRCALPTARAFDHMPTACDHDDTKRKNGGQRLRTSSLPHRIKPLSGHQMRKEAGGELSISVRDNTR